MSSFFRRGPQRDDYEDENDDTIDPELRLRTVRTAASAIAESIRSEQRADRRKRTRTRSFFRRGSEKKKSADAARPAGSDEKAPATPQIPGERRNVYINWPLPHIETDGHGDPIARYVRNKVRTTKYTVVTFIPKNLYEQFRRVANLFFLTLVILQLFPIFGAAAGSMAVVPLAFIITVTAIKDGVEDYRRSVIDEQVNTSSATKIGNWRNVNQPRDPRNFLEKLFSLNKPGSVSKGVRKLREREAGEAELGIRDMGIHPTGDSDQSSVSMSIDTTRGGQRLEDIQSVDSHSYPPGSTSMASLGESSTSTRVASRAPPSEFGSLSKYAQSVASHTGTSFGVMDPSRRSTGAARWERTLWKKLEVGDIVLLRDNDQVPADIVVLATSEEDGLCYLETKNLDGETNLKPRKSVRATMGVRSEEDLERSSFYLDSEPPHQNLYLYHGVLHYRSSQTSERVTEPVSINALLLRGCSLRNTNWIIGLVVFTGADTKIMLNGGDTPSKRSRIEKETNFNVLFNFVVLSLMCLIAGVFFGLWNGDDTVTSAFFFEQGVDATDSAVVNGIITMVSCLIAFQNMVPISLYISIEIVKTIQAYFISQDLTMYYEPYDTPCVPKTWNISDDLGQIEYVFSDKTGTLTQNIMEFQKCSIGGIRYGEGVTEAQRGAKMREGGELGDPEELNVKLASLKQQMLSVMERAFKNRWLQPEKLTLVSPQLAGDLADRSPGSEQRARLIAFFRALALCHTVLADKPVPQIDPHHLVVEYKAESPDEAALVAAARDVGFPFIGKTKDSLEIEVMGQLERYTPLKVLEFNSTRKRMSYIVRGPDGRITLYCKGADSVIYARLAADHDKQLKDQTSKDMEVFANEGLRTLCIAYRFLGEQEYIEWERIYDKAASSIENRDEEIDKANELIEKDLQILGATALEDKLQEGVPEAIELLHRAGIKLWILTGDKLQTAIEIGYSCNLLKPSTELMIISAESADATRAQIEAGLNKIASVLGPPSSDPKERGFVMGRNQAFAVVIDGDTLRHALTPGMKELFLSLGTQCETVVCCRVSPAQKALTVKLVKDGRNAMTLSIGDGANDVAMIQEANIGCGLFGLEGSQAAMSADYAFGQFKYLTRLLIVHGRWSYLRVADMHSNFFYKNVVWAFALFWYLPFNNFNATYLYQFTFILLFNLVFTSLPVIIMGAFDQDLNAAAAMAFPQLYVRGIRGLEYTRIRFMAYMFDGLYQSAVVFFIPYLVWTLGLAVSWNGRGIDSISDFGTTVAVSAIFAANCYVGMNTKYWTVMTWIVVFGSTLVMLLWIVIYSFIPSIDFNDELIVLYGSINFWTTVIFSATVALAPRFIVKYIRSAYFPLDKDLVREMWVFGDLKDQLGIRHRNEKKNKERKTGSALESASMLQRPHLRSGSEMSLHTYEPTNVASPATGMQGPREAYLDTPPTSQAGDATQYAYAKSGLSKETHLSPSPRPDRQTAHSPHPSYYSVSELPEPSPPASPTYKLPTGEITKDGPPSRRSSIATTRASIRQSIINAPLPSSPMPEVPWTPGRHPVSAGYEIHVRSPTTPTPAQAGGRPLSPGFHHQERSASQASYATANDYYSADEGDDDDAISISGGSSHRRQPAYGHDRAPS